MSAGHRLRPSLPSPVRKTWRIFLNLKFRKISKKINKFNFTSVYSGSIGEITFLLLKLNKQLENWIYWSIYEVLKYLPSFPSWAWDIHSCCDPCNVHWLTLLYVTVPIHVKFNSIMNYTGQIFCCIYILVRTRRFYWGFWYLENPCWDLENSFKTSRMYFYFRLMLSKLISKWLAVNSQGDLTPTLP